jgi:uncharacterized protein YdaU (DUF1376 family)
MSERPFMQLYVSDFVGDTLHLSSEQVGVYLLLLMAMWNADGSLPDDDTKLSRVARLSLKKWRAVRPELVDFFTVADGQITHNRLSRELQKSERQSQSRASAGAKGYAAKALNYNNRVQASAQAGLKHLPEPYRKDGATLSDPTESFERVDRNIDAPLFDACVSLSDEKIPKFLTHKSFPASLVARAEALVKAQAERELLEADEPEVAH